MKNLTAIFSSERFALHDTGGHPENQRRLQAVTGTLKEAGLWTSRPILEPAAATVEDIALIHPLEHIRAIERIASSGGGLVDQETIVSAGSFEAASLAAGASMGAVDWVLAAPSRRAFALVRPPGHHAEPAQSMGFCLFNNVAIAARHAVSRRGLARVAILDWDVHHGNGTQAAFYDSGEVLYCSVHEWPLYPGTGAASESGSDDGLGYTINVPLPAGAGDEAYFQVFDKIFKPAIDSFQPSLILISAGFDARSGDPLAMMELTDDGFLGLAERVAAWSNIWCGGRVVAVLEGGYDPAGLASGVIATIQGLDRESTAEVDKRSVGERA